MSTDDIKPLKISKMSPSKPRALAEISPMERRRNSPSWNQSSKKMVGSSSPFSENESPSLVRRRTSIENLKRASRVTNSTMFAREQATEYNPSSPVVIERPLRASHKRGESQTHLPFVTIPKKQAHRSSVKVPGDDDDKVLPAQPLRRQAKSVTFDTAPPQINEYEMATPAPSSIASSSREGSYDDIYEDQYQDEDSFDASLEDTDKTPVVLPYDIEAPAVPSKEWLRFRTASVESESDTRPLPPVPGFFDAENRRHSGNILERVHAAQRNLPVLPQAATVSKSDILGMKDKSLPLEERLRLMGINDETVAKSNSRGGTPETSQLQNSPSPTKSLEERVRHLGLGGTSLENQSPDQATRERNRLQRHGLGIHVREDETATQPELASNFTFPHISRESIMRKIRTQSVQHEELNAVQLASSPPPDYDVDALDPDVPIPSRELSHDGDDDVFVKQEPEEEDLSSLYAIPSLLTGTVSPPAEERSGSVVRHEIPESHENSFYSATEGAEEEEIEEEEDETEDPPTPRAEEVKTFVEPVKQLTRESTGKMSLLEFSLTENSDFHEGLHSFLSPAPEEEIKIPAFELPPQPAEIEVEREVSPVEAEETLDEVSERSESPASVVYHPPTPVEETSGAISPTIPEPLATIKAPGSRLKTRPSATPADLETMAATRRQVSGTHPPPVPEKSPKRTSLTAPIFNTNDSAEAESIEKAVVAHKKRRESFKPKLDLENTIGEDLSLDLDREFNRVIETSKKGYLMRQNTKVVVAKRDFSNEDRLTDSERPASADDAVSNGTESARPKLGHDRSKSWTTEPWNGKVRRKSLRSVDKKGPASTTAAVPPALDIVPENQTAQDQIADSNEESGEGVERGRLFVKVVGVKDLDLPLPQHERTSFSLTLDNGLHCVTTSKLELGRSAPIGQEFELVVLSELEFQLTLQTHITKPAHLESSPNPENSKAAKSPNKKSTFSRFLSSPKKKREQDRIAQQKEEEQRLGRERRAAQAAARARMPPCAWELLHELVGDDGSFGRAYICLKSYEDSCFGRPIVVDVPLFNEWAVEDPMITSSMKSKRGNSLLRRPPYQVGTLSLQLLYVPRPKGCTDEAMPKSMNGCVREMAAAEAAGNAQWEGFLSQQGGDCPYWRRRFFKLEGNNLRAFHETTRQPRAKINLAKASKVVDEKRKNGRRRQSAFADEDQAYMFVEEGFRLRFLNGETIDFYADSPAEKEAWIKALGAVVGKTVIQTGSSWCDVVLARERTLRDQAEKIEKARPRSQAGGDSNMGPAPGRLSSRRHQIKSMIF